MAAATLLEEFKQNDFHISLFEKNQSPGKKLLISWGGRCNITTAITDKNTLSTKYVRGWEFIKKAIGKFSPKKCYDWFVAHNLPLKIEPGDRVFPKSDTGEDVLSVFETIFAKNRDRITFHYQEAIIQVTKEEKFSITSTKGEYQFDSLLIATWGNAYAQTGSTGDGYAFAKSLWHTITPLWPSLSSFVVEEKWLHELSGLTFDEAKIGNELTGSLLLTHFGISGPLAFMLSAELAWDTIGKEWIRTTHFAPIAAMGWNEWDLYLKQSFLESPKKSLIPLLSQKLPKRFAQAFVRHFFKEREEVFVWSISRKDREAIAKLLCRIPLTLKERRPWDEFVTAWWVDTTDIDGETMESKIVDHLYFAWEILNVDGYTWGFSLQICWSSGYVAGRSLGNSL